MKGLEKRLVYLFTGEFFAAVTFTFIYVFYSVNPNDSFSLLYVFVVLNFILLQGSFYWFIKWLRLKRKEMVFANFYKFLYVLKKLNLILIMVGPVIFLVDVFLWERVSYFGSVLTLFIYVFAIIEYVNYYHIQLTNYKKGRGKPSSIAKELYNINFHRNGIHHLNKYNGGKR
ncbi:general stress protein [Alkalihalobacterium elongatum]|uniref:general stress protein n=1 Tax=Alkalihalobacterium elongatum TaxID=2675466 RepID=UPI001C1FB179|nr:general stress protein [Alkalihalobacterium elongatum]